MIQLPASDMETDMRNRNSLVNAALLTATSMSLVGAAAAAPASKAPAPIARASRQFLSSTGTPGVAVIVDDNGTSNIYCFGQARSDKRGKVRPDTVFGIGSVTKTFTCTLLASQVKHGGYTLNDPATNHLPADVARGVQKNYGSLNQVKLVDLATHTSCMPDFKGDAVFADQAPPAKVKNLWETWKNKTGYPIGTHYKYSNGGMVTLAWAVAGNDYNQMLQDVICTPLGMTSTTTGDFIKPGTPQAQGHVTGRPIQTSNADVNSSPNDMLKYLQAQLGDGPPAIEKAIALTHTVQFKTPSKMSFNMGLAWEVSKSSPTVYTKNGGTTKGGCCCWIAVCPERHVGMVVQDNNFKGSGESLTQFGTKLFAQMYGISIGKDGQTEN
jgi:CubicO group peptidase (beta-lactamase class C family)